MPISTNVVPKGMNYDTVWGVQAKLQYANVRCCVSDSRFPSYRSRFSATIVRQRGRGVRKKNRHILLIQFQVCLATIQRKHFEYDKSFEKVVTFTVVRDFTKTQCHRCKPQLSPRRCAPALCAAVWLRCSPQSCSRKPPLERSPE